MRKVRNQKGFTIMELMIVIVIIGILIAIAVPAYNSFRERAQKTACISNLRVIKSAWGLWVADGGTPIAMDAGAMATALTGGPTKYIDVLPTCPYPDAETAYSIAINGAVTCSKHGTVN